MRTEPSEKELASFVGPGRLSGPDDSPAHAADRLAESIKEHFKPAKGTTIIDLTGFPAGLQDKILKKAFKNINASDVHPHVILK